MNKKIAFILALLVGVVAYSQKGTNSPYSYYGLGTARFGGNTENLLMGGIRAYSDSTRVDVRNPASLGKLLLTAYTLGVSADFREMKTDASSYKTQTTAIDYLSLSFPVYKGVGVSFGLMPYSSVGYNLSSTTKVGDKNSYLSFEGNGGLNRVYLAAGYEFMKGLRVGAGMNFNFGNTEIENKHRLEDSSYTTQEQSTSSLKGVSFNLGLEYERKITDKLTLSSTLSYVPKAEITSSNTRILSVLQYTALGSLLTKDTQTVDLKDLKETKLVIPSELTIGAGVGRQGKWFAGLDYTLVNMNEFSNPFITSTFVEYQKGYKFSLGGFYLPNANLFATYWKQITYRAGLHFEDTGILLKNQKITDFGISFGMSLPVKGFSNATIGAVYGKRGTLSQNLIKENYITLKIALTLNDRWFQKSKYN